MYKNDNISIADIKQLNPNAIVIGPGPCTPNEAGITLELIKNFAGLIPILGICLGHQAIGQAFGGKVIRATQVMHGRVSPIYHNNQGVFNNLTIPFKATRYHSLVLDKSSLPDCLQITAWTQRLKITDTKQLTIKNDKQAYELDEIMGIRHTKLAIESVQFHPESILSEAGYQLLNNFLAAHKLSILEDNELPIVG